MKRLAWPIITHSWSGLGSLVSELGSALGLFLGFSFFGAVESMQTFSKAILAIFTARKLQ